MKHLLPILFILLGSQTIYAQQDRVNEIEDLKKQLETTTADTARVRIMCTISIRGRAIDLEESIRYSHEALELAQKTNDPISIARALNAVGQSYTYQGEYSTAIKYIEKSIETAIWLWR